MGGEPTWGRANMSDMLPLYEGLATAPRDATVVTLVIDSEAGCQLIPGYWSQRRQSWRTLESRRPLYGVTGWLRPTTEEQ
jgi:hypothetical protein